MSDDKLVHILGPKTNLDIGDCGSNEYDGVVYPYDSGYAIQYIEYTTFSGGEIHLDMENCFSKINYHMPSVIRARLQSANDVMALFSLMDIYKRRGHIPDILEIPYFPYARQDRATTPYTSFSLKWFADLINTFNAPYVFSYDPHSVVTPTLVNNFRSPDITGCMSLAISKGCRSLFNGNDYTVVSPDAGGYKRASQFAEKIKMPFATGMKVRNPATGKIEKVEIFGDVGENAIIIDDICDGGRTFIELAKILKEQRGCKKVALYVTHGIFSRGLEVFDGLIDKIITTSSFVTPFTDVNNPLLHVEHINFPR
jgi:ribose-phosphate pyrophosphokinase